MSVNWSSYNRIYQAIGTTSDVASHADNLATQAMARVNHLEQQVRDLSIVVVTLVEQLAAANAVTVASFQAAIDAALAQDHADAVAERQQVLATAENVWDSAGGPTTPLPKK